MTTMIQPGAMERATTDGLQVLQPSGWPRPKGYANGIAAEGRLVVTGGVVGWDLDGRFADGLVAQSGRLSKTSWRSWPRAAHDPNISCV